MKNIVSKKQLENCNNHSIRRGFTLIEMMVAVALVVLMMTLFATVFQTAAETISLQKGIAENDQRSRTLNTVIRNDLQNRTFTKMDPWGVAEDFTLPNADPTKRTGYFYISENSLDDQTDDVLCFTVRLDPNDQPLFGRALALPLAGPVLTDIDQPEGDDGQIEYPVGVETLVQNNQGASRSAEIIYFLRNGNLYRRVLLIREQFSASGTWPTRFSDTAIYPLTNNFLSDFDYSAHFDDVTGGVILHRQLPAGIYLDNTAGANVSLGEPIFRFGHLFKTGDANHGNPLEFINGTFIGRYTHQETSDSSFLYPGALPDWDTDATLDYPMDRANGLLNVSADGIVTYNDGAVDTEFDGDRIAEDILLSRVHSFDVKVWDEALGEFVDVGHNIAGGDFEQNTTKNLHLGAATPINYGPSTTNTDNRIFDTWHREYDHDGDSTDDPPPFDPANPVSAIQITIRFFDVSSGQTRQTTIVEAMPYD